MTQPDPTRLWQHLVQWQPALAAALAAHCRALPADWPQREFSVGRADAALTLPPGATGEQFPDRAPEIAPYDEIAPLEDCPACEEVGGMCRFHEGYASGHHGEVQAQLDAVKARPEISLTAFLRWRADVAEAEDRGQVPPGMPSAVPQPSADRAAYARGIRDAITEIERKAAGVIPRLHRMADQAHPPTGQAQAAAARAAEFSEMENARRSFPDGVRPALCKALAAADQRNFGRLPIPERRRYTEQADAVLRLMGWRETQLARQYQDTLKALRATEADRAAILREAATAIDAAQAREEATAWAQAGEDGPDPEIEVEGGAVRAMAGLLRRMAAEAQPPADQTVLRDLVAATLREHGTVHLGDQVPADEYDCCADAALTAGPVRCPLCPTSVTLHTPNGARAHFTHVHPEQRITGRGLGPWPLIVTNAVEAQQQDELLAQPQSCRSDTGITVGLVDSLITTLRVLAPRDLSPGPVQEALTDLTHDPDLDTVLRALSRRQDTETQQQGETPAGQAQEPDSPAYARLKAAAHAASEAAHLHAMHGMKRAFQLCRRYGEVAIPVAEVLNALGLDENANAVEPADPAPVPDPTWPRRAWDLGLLHNAAVLANPRPAAGARQDGAQPS